MSITGLCFRLLPFHIIILFLLFKPEYSFAATKLKNDETSSGQNQHFLVHIGVILDLNSPIGTMTDLCIKMALSDFYSEHPNYRTRLDLRTKDAESLLDTNFAVLELLKHEEVHGILGTQVATEDKFLAELGGKVRVPVISFTSRSSTLPYSQNRYFIRTTLDDMYQAQALAAIFQEFQWSEVVILYEDTEYGNQFLSHLNKAFQKIDIGIAYMSAITISSQDSRILEELKKLMAKQTRVFLVHMNPTLGYQLFSLAKKAGMMSEGYAWIITDYLSDFLSSKDFVARDSMEGVLGIRPYVSRSKKFDSFQERWKRIMVLKSRTGSVRDINIYGLGLYDTIFSLAISAEKIVPVNSSLLYVNTSKNGTDTTNLKISAFGPRLLNELSHIKFRGLSGEFQLVNGQLKPSAFEIFNVIGNGERTVGFWTVDKGISRELNSTGEPTHSSSIKSLKNATRPKGWPLKLRVGVPVKLGFTEFVNVKIDDEAHQTTGFSIDIFLAALQLLPFPTKHEFYHYNGRKNCNWSYDDMLHEIPQEGSFVRKFLKEQLHIDESRLHNYSSVEEYHDGMTRGSQRGGIDAIFDEIPYMKIFLKKYDPQYKIVGPTYRTDGFGFAFPIGSPLTAHFSKAILNVTQGPNMTSIVQTNFGPGYPSEDRLSSPISQRTSSLTFFDFGGLFIIVGSVTLFALFCSETLVGRKFTSLTAQYSQKCLCFVSSKFHSTRNVAEEIHASVPDSGATSGEGGDAIVVGEIPSGREGEICDPGQNNEGASAEDQEVKTDNTEERNSMAHN